MISNRRISEHSGRKVYLLPLLCIIAIFLVGIASAGTTAAPTVTKTASPADINLAGSGVNPEETTVSVTVTGAGSTSTSAVPMDVVFAIDSSGSMTSSDPSNLRLSAAKSFIAAMDSSRDTVGVVSWDDGIDFYLSLTNNFATAEANVNNVDSSGGTDLNVGLNKAINILDANTRTGDSAKVIIFLTDGVGSYSSSTAQAAAQKGYKIYSIGLGNYLDPAPLQDMATITGGKYYSSPGAANLQAIFNDIFVQVTTSTIPYNVDVIETTQSYIVDESSFNIAPDSVVTDGSGITTITWNNIGNGDGSPDLSDDETIVLSFKAKSNQVGDNLGVDALGTAKVNYKDAEGNDAGSVDIPQAYINVKVPNNPPVANAGPDQVVEQTNLAGTPVTLDGSGSTDDGLISSPLTYTWTWKDGPVAGVTGDKPTITLPLGGPTTVTLTVSDGQFSSADTVDITVKDTTAPTLTCPATIEKEQANLAGTEVPLTATATDICDANVVITNDAPAVFPLGKTIVTFTATDASGNKATGSTLVSVVDTTKPTLTCPLDVTVEQTDLAGTPVNLPAATATDICDANVVITNDARAVFPLGTTPVTFTATDASGNTETGTTLVTVVDTTKPAITAKANPALMWAPDHKVKTVKISDLVTSVTDICDANVGVKDVKITSVSSDEVENAKGTGSGNTVSDITITGPQSVDLRAEREGTGDGRVYTINYQVTDASGNVAIGSSQIWVLHDTTVTTATDSGVKYTVKSTYV